MALLLLRLVTRPDLHLPLLTLTAKREDPSGPEPLALLVQANLETPVAILRALQEKLLMQASQPELPEKEAESLSQPANQRLLLLLEALAKQRDLLLHSAELQERQHRLGRDSPVPQGRARRYSRGPGPCAFFREIPDGRKYNRAERCADLPISGRYQPPRNRRGPAGCDNRCSRSQHTRARRARTFPIAAEDKCRCLPRRTADSDARSASLE